VFGKEQARQEADEKVFGFQKLSFWKYAAMSMKDGELLHIAVELGSLDGVKSTAWPGMLRWKSLESGKTALEFAQSCWGADNEISTYLQGLLWN